MGVDYPILFYSSDMEKFKLSKHIAILKVKDNFEEAVPEKFKRDHFHLRDSVNDRDFFINKTVKYFVDKFSKPLNLPELVQIVKNDLKNDSSEVEKTCTEFFNLLCRKNILVLENADESFAKTKPKYKAGDLLDQFIVEKLLSDRGYLEIYLVTGKLSGKQSVIKYLSFVRVGDTNKYNDELAELEREFSLLNDVAHIPAMCSVYGFEKGEGYAYINLEYIKGLSIERFLHTKKRLKEKDCLQLLKSVLTGFAALHNTGIIHGDIHSSNLLVKSETDIRIIDLGYSRKVDMEPNEMLSYGGVMHYMPPERIEIRTLRKYTDDASLSSDVYQVGVLAYLVLYKTLPFNGFVWEELSRNIKESAEVYPEHSFLKKPVSKALVGIIKKCLSKKPADRYKTAGEILADFENQVLKLKLQVN